MEGPRQLAGVHVPGAHVARGSLGRVFLVVPPAMTRFLYTMGGELSALRPGSPCMISGVFRLTMPLSPKPSLGLPVFAFSEYSLPSLEPKTICARRLRVAGPVFDAARRRAAGRQLKGPDFLSGGRFQRHDARVRRGADTSFRR